MIKKTLSIEQIQRLEFDILRYFKEVCDKNGLTYYLAYGTLIGAARHQGFIPWDDDMDVHMPRQDYKKLVEILRREEHPYYRLVSVETHPNFTAPLPKIIDTRTTLIQHYDLVERMPLGVYIDIFMLDGASDDFDEAKRRYLSSYALYRKWRKAETTLFPADKPKWVGLLRFIKNIPYKIHGISRYVKDLDRKNGELAFRDCDFVATFETGTLGPERNIWKRECFGEGQELPFWGVPFRVPHDYDAVLRSEYGDYMQLPPIEKRVSNHNYTLYVNEDLEIQ